LGLTFTAVNAREAVVKANQLIRRINPHREIWIYKDIGPNLVSYYPAYGCYFNDAKPYL